MVPFGYCSRSEAQRSVSEFLNILEITALVELLDVAGYILFLTKNEKISPVVAHLLTPSFQVLSFHLQGCGGDDAAEHCGELLPTCESFSIRQRVTVMHPAPEAIHFRFIETRPCLLASTRFGTNRLTFLRSF
jgi:hypothetical protein